MFSNHILEGASQVYSYTEYQFISIICHQLKQKSNTRMWWFSYQCLTEMYFNFPFVFFTSCLLGKWQRLWKSVRPVCTLLRSVSGGELLTSSDLKQSFHQKCFGRVTQALISITLLWMSLKALCFSVVHVIGTTHCVHLEQCCVEEFVDCEYRWLIT